jgi:ATP-dependent helicase/DNAse subunit B
MRLLLGEPGSGKTTRILSELRSAGRSGDVRLVVPTATMAEHLRNLLAREGQAVRPSCVTTMAALVHEIVPEIATADSSTLTLLTRMVLQESPPRTYAALAGSPGLAKALAGAMEELANAGCDALQWTALEGMRVHNESALAQLYEAVEAKLSALGLSPRAGQLAAAARRVRERGTGIRSLWLDGFYTLSRGELELVRAFRKHAAVTVALPEWEGAASAIEVLRRMGLHEERLHRVRATPRVTLLAAPTRDREAQEAALRLLEERRTGRAWHEMGVVIRGPHPYAPLLDTTLRRAGIPVRAYFATPLSGHPVGRFFISLVEAALSGWEGGRTLKALRASVASPGQCSTADSRQQEITEALPFAGLDAIRRLTGDSLAALRSMENWDTQTALPAQWAEQLAGLSSLVAEPRGAGPFPPEIVQAWRSRAAAMRAFSACLAPVASLLPGEPVLLDGFWKHVRTAMDDTSIRLPDTRRDAVSILDAVEARQWELKVVVVCGLLEGEFPATAMAHPILGEDLRLRLRQSGVLLRTRADREAEEAFLVTVARSRATDELVLSWPEHDEQGRPTLRAFALDAIEGDTARARKMDVEPRASATRAPLPALQDDDLLTAVRLRHARHRPTALEIFLQCPFRFHAEHTLDLKEPPATPAARLDGRALGTLVHRVIAEWHRGAGPIEEIFETQWARLLSRERIPPSHRVELARLTMLRSLRFYQSDNRLRDGWTTTVEVPLTLHVAGAEVSGRADRVDSSSDGVCVVYDFKYSGDESIRRKLKMQDAGLLVQGGLYLAALRDQGRPAGGFYFAAVRGGTAWRGSEDPAEVGQWITKALAMAESSILRIAQGDIPVQPADAEACGYCAFVDACRIQEGQWQTKLASSESS